MQLLDLTADVTLACIMLRSLHCMQQQSWQSVCQTVQLTWLAADDGQLTCSWPGRLFQQYSSPALQHDGY
jgi:hypothetical protein